MVAHGVSLRAVQMIGGWTSLRMVERYSHLDDAELQRAV
jgi:site-specific recombinase XerD